MKDNLESLLSKMLTIVEKRQQSIEDLHPDQHISAANLLQYLTLRSEDIRTLQEELHINGLSSLDSSESHILRQVQEILQRLGKKFSPEEISPCDYHKGRALITQRSTQLFGSKKDPAIPYLMVTFATQYADNYQLVKRLLEKGMNVARINCAHDNPEIWKQMIDLIHSASEETGFPCKVYMDIAGPKMRVTILGIGTMPERITLVEGQEILFAERSSAFDPTEVMLSCDEPGIIEQLQPDDRVVFDDGLIETRVKSIENGIAVLKVGRISSKKSQLKSGKGINFPDTQITIGSLTSSDREALPFICEHADLVGYSFVRKASDVKELQQILSAYEKKPKIILKIETAEAVKNIPALLMQGMTDEVFGVMIARGDLAVEIGFERTSEIQEEILWISESAHVPVIWATQVLESLNKSGIATRAEVTDAAHGAHSECVMINKGDYVVNVLKTLIDILRRSGDHHAKKRYTFRPLKIASDYLA